MKTAYRIKKMKPTFLEVGEAVRRFTRTKNLRLSKSKYANREEWGRRTDIENNKWKIEKRVGRTRKRVFEKIEIGEIDEEADS